MAKGLFALLLYCKVRACPSKAATKHTSVQNFITNHMLLEARLVAGSKLTRDMSHPPASYKEGVSFPGETEKRRAQSV